MNALYEERMKNKILSAFGIGVILQWLSLFLSYRKLPNAYETINGPVATGGFPFKAFEYPIPPRGHDWPPMDTWPAFFLNLTIWIAIGFVIALSLGKASEKKEVAAAMLLFLTIPLSLFGIFYILFQFD